MTSFPKCVTVCCWANISMPVTRWLGCWSWGPAWLGASLCCWQPLAEAPRQSAMATTARAKPLAMGSVLRFVEMLALDLPENALFAIQVQLHHGLDLEGTELWQPCLCWTLPVGRFNEFSTSASKSDFSVYDEGCFKNMLKGSYTKF